MTGANQTGGREQTARFVEHVLLSMGNRPTDEQVARAAQRIARYVASVWRANRRAEKTDVRAGQ